MATTNGKQPIVQTGLKKTKSTTGTHFYEVDKDRQPTAHVRSIYVRKEAFVDGVVPSEITVEIKAS